MRAMATPPSASSGLACMWLALWALVGASALACTECEVDYDCPGTRICNDGVCEDYVCRRDEDCPPGNRCEANTCRENPAEPAPDAPDAVVIRPGR